MWGQLPHCRYSCPPKPPPPSPSVSTECNIKHPCKWNHLRVFEKGCWISDAYQLHGLCRGEVKNRIKTYDSGRNLRPGDDLEEGEDEHIGACKIGEKNKKNIQRPDIPLDRAWPLLLSNHVERVKKRFGIPQVLTRGLIFVVISSEPSSIAK